MAIKVEGNQISLGVRDLVGAYGQRQLLSSFPLPQRGMLGKNAQAKVQQKKNHRFGLFHSEYFLRRQYTFQDYTFLLQGRIDGVFQFKNRVEIEEIKSVILNSGEFKSLRPERFPEFSEQVLYYAYLLQDELDGIEVAAYLILVNLVNDAQRTFNIPYQRLHVEQLLLRRFSHIVSAIERERQQLEQRKAELELINFDLPEERPEQKKMMLAVDDALKNRTHLLVSAPTGSGKTAAALFPAIRFAYANNKHLFFITSKTTQQNIVKETLLPLIEQGLDLKVLFMRAAEKMCANNVYFCHEAYCLYAKDYQERMLGSNIITDLLNHQLVTPEIIYDAAVQQMLCPFEVALDLAHQCNIVVGDYNYVFDPAATLKRLFNKKDYSDWILIIDETHNLYERGMQYLSPQIKMEKVSNLMKRIQLKNIKIYQQLFKALQEIHQMLADLNLEGEIHFSGRQYFNTSLNVQAWDDVFRLYESAFIKYLIYKIRKRMIILDDPLEDFYFNLRRFVQVAHFQERAFVPFYDAQDGGILKIQCCDPSHYLGEKIDGFHAVTAMSATLDPIIFYQNVLGFNEDRTSRLQLKSPFPNENRRIIIVPNISTRYKDRTKNYPKIAAIIEDVIRFKEGNYLVFFPSFDFIQNVNLFLGKVTCEKILQKPGMNDNARDEILQTLKKGKKKRLLLAVMGGIFSEGVDYAGEMAIGVIIVSPALPKITYERELLRQYYDEKLNMGMEYAYVYPGMNKVVQSVGRLIRSASDHGIIVLIGERFAGEDYNALLPDHWFEKPGDIEITEHYQSAIKEFWRKFT